VATTTVAKGLPSVHDLDLAIEQITGAYHPLFATTWLESPA
jgi:hypothetical protein